MVNPMSFMTANVAMSDTGMVSMGIITARQFCRNMRITIITMSVVSTNVTATSSIEAVTNCDVSSTTEYFTPGGKYWLSLSSSFLAAFDTSSALAPGSCLIPSSAASLPETSVVAA